MKNSLLLNCFAFFLFIGNGFCQVSNPSIHDTSNMVDDYTKYPVVGKPCPDFSFDTIEYFAKKRAFLKDFKGKWLVLDFWNQYCTGCIQNMPHVNALQTQFRDKVQFVMVAWIDRPNTLKPTRILYERIRKTQHLDLAITYDSIVGNNWDLATLPYIVVIDPNGIVRAIALNLTAENLTDIISGKMDVKYTPARNRHLNVQNSNTHKYKYNPFLPLFIRNNGGADTAFLFRSVLAKWNPTMPADGDASIRDIYNGPAHKGTFQISAVNLRELYNFAYIDKNFRSQYEDTSFYGKLYAEPLFEIRDSLALKPDINNMYSYSLSLPLNEATVESAQKKMQHDLEDYFGYAAHWEERMMPCYELVVTDPEKVQSLYTKGEIPSYNRDIAKDDTDPTGFQLINQPISKLIQAKIINTIPKSMSRVSPVFDATGIQKNIDIMLHASFYNELLNELRKSGLDLKESKRNMKVLVVSDKK